MTRPDLPDDQAVHATITVSAPRRWAAYGVQMILGALLIYAAVGGLATGASAVVLFALGLLILWGAERLRRATGLAIYLTDDGLFDTSGATLAEMDQIQGVSRGAFALKPSNGFALTLKSSQSRVWVPGLWWRFGRRVGVGGVTNAGAAKFMAEQISLRLAGVAD